MPQWKMLSILYFAVATFYAVFAFRNFSIFSVVLICAMYAAIPMCLILLLRVQGKTGKQKNWVQDIASIPALFGVAGVLLMTQLSGLFGWDTYVNNFANEKMSLSLDGIHHDTAFHVAIIQEILGQGIASTGQHLSPVISYHVLSHYVDAAIVATTGLSPWDAYALLFFAKSTALTLGVIYLAARVSHTKSPKVFWVTLLIVYPTFTATWLVIGSHGEWVPAIALVLSAPWCQKVLSRERVSLGSLLQITLLIAFLTFGKVSIGFAFACVVGLYLLIRHQRDLRLYLFGASWAVFLYLYSLRYQSIQIVEELSVRFSLSWLEISSLLLLGIVLLLIWKVTGAEDSKRMAIVTFLAMPIISTVAFLVLATRSDVAYFFHGLFSVILVITIPLVLRPVSNQELADSQFDNLTLLALGSSLLLACMPVAAQSALFEMMNLEKDLTLINSMNTETYKWYNRGREVSDQVTVSAMLKGKVPIYQTLTSESYALNFRNSLTDVLISRDLSKPATALYIPKNLFQGVGEQLHSQPWSTGLTVVALTGMELVFGVQDDGPRSYGFSDYGTTGLRKDSNEVSTEELCKLKTNVIELRQVLPPVFEIACK